METWGNKTILEHKKIGFLCSQKVGAAAIWKCYDWAKAQRKAGNCIVIGNHSQIEKDVFDILLKGEQPIILVLARNLKKRWEKVVQEAVESNRLLVISPFENEVNRISRESAKVRNEFILKLCDEIVLGYMSKGGQLEILIKECNVNFIQL